MLHYHCAESTRRSQAVALLCLFIVAGLYYDVVLYQAKIAKMVLTIRFIGARLG